MIAPSGEVIPLKPKYSIYIENEVGTENEFWDQDYVKTVVSSGEVIPLKPKYFIYIENEVGIWPKLKLHKKTIL